MVFWALSGVELEIDEGWIFHYRFKDPKDGEDALETPGYPLFVTRESGRVFHIGEPTAAAQYLEKHLNIYDPPAGETGLQDRVNKAYERWAAKGGPRPDWPRSIAVVGPPMQGKYDLMCATDH